MKSFTNTVSVALLFALAGAVLAPLSGFAQVADQGSDDSQDIVISTSTETVAATSTPEIATSTLLSNPSSDILQDENNSTSTILEPNSSTDTDQDAAGSGSISNPSTDTDQDGQSGLVPDSSADADQDAPSIPPTPTSTPVAPVVPPATSSSRSSSGGISGGSSSGSSLGGGSVGTTAFVAPISNFVVIPAFLNPSVNAAAASQNPPLSGITLGTVPENPPLFDVSSAPVGAVQQRSIPLILLVMIGALILFLLLYAASRIRAFMVERKLKAVNSGHDSHNETP